MHRLFLGALAFVALSMTALESASAQTAKDQLIATWRLTAATATDGTGTTVNTRYGDKPDGFLSITGDGRAIAMLVNAATPKYGAMTNDVAGNIMKSITAWAAKYEVDGAAPTADGTKITFRIDAGADPNLNGTGQAFMFKMDGGKLILKSIVPPGAVTGPTTLTF